MKKVLMTGSTGFVGQNILSNLSYKFNCIDRASSQTKLISSNCEAYVHLAGKAHDLKKTSAPNEYYEVNFELTKSLYNAFLKSNAKKFIFLSSVKASADSVIGVLNENDKPNPQTHYGKSKLLAEEYIQSQPLPPGKSYYILRPCMIHGPGNKGNLNLLFNFVKKGLPYPLAAFDNKRSFLSMQNLCFVINELIIQDNIPSGIYNVADDEPLSTNAMVNILATSLGLKAKLLAFPVIIINVIAKIGDVLRLPLTTERLNKLTESYVVSNQKIKKALNKELPLTAIAGLKITADSFNKA